MHIVKFPWVKHAEGPRSFEIYSVSVSPDGSRLATGGLDGKVKLWSIDTFNKYKNFNSNLESLNNNECKPLCSMSRHAGAITCVRFCPNSRFLASGSDDKLILIWEKDEEKTRIMKMNRSGIENSTDSNFLFSSSNNNDNNNNSSVDDIDLEHWTVRKRLVAHDNDIQDMAWAPDGSILVTVGLDRSIVVWNGLTFEKIKRFDIHQSHVKGVVFDPAGKYFATCSDDRTMRIFRYRKGVNVDGTDMQFVVENIIRDPFEKSPLTTYFRRCSWSPDGLYIAAPNGTNEGVNANVVIKRGSWESELSLIGHRLPCEVCSFSPRLYDVEFDNNNNNNSKPSSSRSETVIITAGQDKTLALWSSSCATPLCVVTQISAKSITDVAWNPNGLNVYICGLDGVVLSLFFDEKELGHVVPWEENNRALIRYGKDRDMFFPESVEQLKLEEFAEKRGFFSKNLNLVLKPDRLQSLMGGTDQSINSNNLNDKLNSNKPVMNVLIPRSKKHPNKQMPVPKINTLTEKNNNTTKVNILSSKTQKVTITKSGKKRVAPTLITNPSADASNNNDLFSNSTKSTSTELKNLNLKKKQQLNSILALPHPPLPKHGLSTLTNSLRSNIINDETDIENLDKMIDYIAETDNSHKLNTQNRKGKSTINGKQRFSLSGSSLLTGNNNHKGGYYSHSNNINNNRRNGNSQFGTSDSAWNKRRKTMYPDWIKDSVVNPMTIYSDKNSNSLNVIIGKKMLNDKVEQVIEIRYENENVYKYLDHHDDTELDNSWNELDFASHIVAKSSILQDCKETKVDDWSLFINDKVSCIGESEFDGISYWCICTENGKILILSSTGRQLCGSIELGSNIVKLVCNKHIILCVCANSLIYSWEFKKMNDSVILGRSIMESISLAPIINTHFTSSDNNKKKIEVISKLNNIYLRPNGCPLIVVNNDKFNYIYSFDPLLESWIEILDSWYITILPKSKLEKEMKVLTDKDRILKFITDRFIRSKDVKQENQINNKAENKIDAKNDNETLDESDTVINKDSKELEEKFQFIYENWKSANECVIECINRKLEKC